MNIKRPRGFPSMASHYSSRHLITVIVILCMAMVQIGLFPAVIRAADPPVNLVLGGTGATAWNEYVKPGSSGTKTVTLQNTGTESGSVTIWLSNIISGEGLNPQSETGNTADPGELDLYLLLSIAVSGLNTNMTLPATIGNFPQSVSDAKFIKINSLNAGDTVTLVWHWKLSPETGNDVQGDMLSFSINYTLEQLTTSTPPIITSDWGGSSEPIAPPMPDTPHSDTSSITPIPALGSVCSNTITVNMLGQETSATMTTDGVLCQQCLARDGQNEYQFQLEQGTRLSSTAGVIPTYIIFQNSSKSIQSPEGSVLVSSIFEMNAYADKQSVNTIPIRIEPMSKLSLAYDPDKLPANASEVYIAYYNNGWNAVTGTGGPAEVGTARGEVNHFTVFAVLARVPPEQDNKVTPVQDSKFEPWILIMGILAIIVLIIWGLLMIMYYQKRKNRM